MSLRLSVNINKVATLRNARGGDNPNLVKVALDCERFGAEGITVHPRPDERHIRYQDVYDLSKVLTTEFNIEGNPQEDKFVELVLATRPAQVTLVPDALGVLTSSAGWDTRRFAKELREWISVFQSAGIRTSIFTGTDPDIIRGAAETGTNRVELYTEPYAVNFFEDKIGAVTPFVEAAKLAHSLGLGINAGHDLSLDNLRYFQSQVPHLEEVSIGHALVCDALYLGLENTIQLYLREAKWA